MIPPPLTNETNVMAASAPSHPEATVSTLETLLGPKLFRKGTDSAPAFALLRDTKLVALYFSAHWCPPCQKFTPILKRFYENTSRKDIEIVYISSDRTLDEFLSYYGSMPWLAVPTDAEAAQRKNELARTFRLQGIPTLIVLENKTGLFVTSQARQQVYDLGEGITKESAQTLVDQWLSQDKVPIEQAHLAEPGMNIVMQLLMAVLKNPMYMFGLLYFVKMVMRYMQGSAPVESDTPPLGQESHEEF